MVREIQDPTVNARGEEEHPAFAVAVVTRSTGTPRPLFQSDLQHRETVTLSFQRARRERQLSRDWIYPGKEIIEVEMSQSQWAQLVASAGIGSGTPVTLRSVDMEMTPGIPFEPRTKQSVDELKSSVETLLSNLKEAVEELNRVENAKAPIKERRAAREKVTRLVNQAAGNTAFVAEMLNEHVENVVTQAKSDIESMVMEASSALEIQDRAPRLEIL